MVRQLLSYVIIGLTASISLLLFLRIFEMLNHCYRTIIAYKNRLDIRFVVQSWPITMIFRDIRFFGLIYRLPILIPLLSFLVVIYEGPPIVLVICTSVLFTSIIIQLAQTLLSKIIFGSHDKYMRHWFTVIQWKYRDKNLLKISNETARIDMSLFLVGFVILTICAYASIFFVNQQLDSEAFKGEIKSYFDALYFSVVTFATVGFGDITPVSSIAKLLVVSEILVSFGILVMLVLSYSLSIQDNEKRDHSAERSEAK